MSESVRACVFVPVFVCCCVLIHPGTCIHACPNVCFCPLPHSLHSAESICLAAVSLTILLLSLPLVSASGTLLLQMTPDGVSDAALHKCLRQVCAASQSHGPGQYRDLAIMIKLVICFNVSLTPSTKLDSSTRACLIALLIFPSPLPPPLPPFLSFSQVSVATGVEECVEARFWAVVPGKVVGTLCLRVSRGEREWVRE